ncbi:hypothetical protein TIFTF001_001558 [Ficus carica]|uniref:Non-specific lipid-transfer protein n=1 Tax=Ficus carica TaxID=3494 RepID=A0AA88CMG8_FICCA|nr:hypothetical protein TIFTF001_001558 [Ficus carica]
MKKVSAIAAMFVVVAVTTVFMAEPGQAAITCSQVDMALRPCLEYLRGTVTQPPTECCSGVATIKQDTPTKADRQIACQCVKRAADALTGLNEDAAKNLPTKCEIQINVPISKNVDCNK